MESDTDLFESGFHDGRVYGLQRIKVDANYFTGKSDCSYLRGFLVGYASGSMDTAEKPIERVIGQLAGYRFGTANTRVADPMMDSFLFSPTLQQCEPDAIETALTLADKRFRKLLEKVAARKTPTVRD